MKYQCKICGKTFVQDDVREVEICPSCGAPKSMLEPVMVNPTDDTYVVRKKRYRCKVCGYIYDDAKEAVPFESLPDDWKCPLCGVPKDMFEAVPYEEIMVEAEMKYETVNRKIDVDPNNMGIAMILDKCTNCGKCKTTCENIVGIHYDGAKSLAPVCIECGQCILNCPVGALVPKYNYQKVFKLIDDPEKVVIAFTAPAVRVALGEEFGMPAGIFVEGKMVAALRSLGFDYVLDVTFGADLTIMEEASELIRRINQKEKMPMFTSCCPAWVKYMEIYYPDLKDHLSSCKSPISMQAAIIKTYYAKKMGLDPKKIVTVSITPCTAKKAEIRRPEMNASAKFWHDDEMRDTDYVLTTSELGIMLREKEVDFKTIQSSEFDSMQGQGSGGGLIFGNTGGVMESALRTAYYFLNGKDPDLRFLGFNPVRGMDFVKEATVDMGKIKLNVLVVHGLTNLKPYLDELREKGTLQYDFIEVMNCHGGCIGGGGQPLINLADADKAKQSRITGLYEADVKDTKRASYQNPDIKRLYDEFLGAPLSETSEELLHTTFTDRHEILGE